MAGKIVYAGLFAIYVKSMGSYEEIRQKGGFTRADVLYYLQFLDAETPEDAKQIIEESDGGAWTT